MHEEADLPFLEVYMDTPIAVCEERDPKGLYKRARAGEIKMFTGIDDPYEPPESPEIVLRTGDMDPPACAQYIFERLLEMGILEPREA
jgi:adenylylsulfate kinase-like enzyme